MTQKPDTTRSGSRKPQILIADDEIINREILREMLKEEFELLFACDGAETLEQIRTHRETLSLVLLDIMMPVMTGLEVLRITREEEGDYKIPIIVTTADRETEIESLELGAVDFISKPYPAAGVILARLKRVIELFEDRDTIKYTERDALTELYNREFFYRYALRADQFRLDTEMDACIVDINHFHMINERYGKAYGDDVLKRVGRLLRSSVEEEGGIVGRRESDTFMVYCPHREDYPAIMERILTDLTNDGTAENRVRLRMGIYSNVDRGINIEQRFDQAKMAADTVKGSFTRTIAYYDRQLHTHQLYMEQLIEDFPAAIAENQFQVYYQPKFDIRPDTPVLASAEALVRWIHPERGMISPGDFIPLFEENGLIQRLDTYVWREAARQIREWKDRLHYSVPVSVNVSRIDLFDPNLADTLQSILREFSLTGKDFLLEVTESAYTQDAERIIQTVEHLRSLDFQVEMDDFGTGYSSLHMISSLPIDALKLDMLFIRDAFQEGGNIHMLEVIIGISDFLSVPVIAEGVETEEQLHALRSLGCDIVQGYFFSKPVPAVDFEAFILQKKEADLAAARGTAGKSGREPMTEAEALAQKAKLNVLRNQPVQTEETDAEEDGGSERPGIHLRSASIFFLILSLIAALALLIADLSVTGGYRRMEKASDRYSDSQTAAADMESGSDYLTDRVRSFVITGDVTYLNDFIEEVQVTRRRDNAVESLGELLDGHDQSALEDLNMALELSNELVETENHAIRLRLESGSYDMEQIPEAIRQIRLTPEEKAMSAEQLRETAEMLVFDESYMEHKNLIRENVQLCTQALIRTSSQELERASAKLLLLVNVQTVLTCILLVIMLCTILLITFMVRKPLIRMVESMQKQEAIPPTGVEELRFVTRIYNRILKENQAAREKLSREASLDALTGLFNRGAYDLWMESTDMEHIALLLIDVDYFKTVNDTYGHSVGDLVLKRVAEILKNSFRSVDILCRIGGDEFAVVMSRVDSSMRQLVYNKIMHANELLQHPKDDLPPVSLSVGVAFSDRKNPKGDIFKDADEALYRVKEAGRNGCEIY